MRHAFAAVLIASLVLTGCALQFTRPTSDQRTNAAMLRLGTFEALRPLFQKYPEAGGYVCPVVVNSIMPALSGTCADIELKDQAIYILSAAARQWIPDWDVQVKPCMEALDALFGPKAHCSPEQMRYLRAFFMGVGDACAAGTNAQETKGKE